MALLDFLKRAGVAPGAKNAGGLLGWPEQAGASGMLAGLNPRLPEGVPGRFGMPEPGAPQERPGRVLDGRPARKRKKEPDEPDGAKTAETLGRLDEEAFAQHAYALFREFYDAYTPFWLAVKENELFYQSRDWEAIGMMKNRDKNEPMPTTPSIQSVVDGLKADRMEGYPEAIILPQKLADKTVAGEMNSVVKHVLEAGDHRRHYEQQIHDSLICGWQVCETGWDVDMHFGLGEAYLRRVDPRCFMPDPRCENIQDGRACFKFTARSREWVKEHYPRQYRRMQPDSHEYTLPESNAPVKDMGREPDMLLIEYWYREYDGEAWRAHMALLCGGVLLEDSRRAKPEGYYLHGEYPFTVQPLYPIAGCALGFGIVDALKNPQIYADKLDQLILRNALLSSRTRMLVNRMAEFDEDALLDMNSEVVHGNRIDEGAVRWFQTGALPAWTGQMRQIRLQEIKEYSGVNDVSRGQAGQGVTAASAIVALQEAANKRSRLAERGDHAAFARAVRQMMDVLREYYDARRTFLVTDGSGEEREMQFSGAQLYRAGEHTGQRLPIEFSVTSKIQRQNVYKTTYYNDLALQLLGMGVLTPPEALEMMHFEGVDKVRAGVLERMNMTMQLQAAQAENGQLKQLLAQETMARGNARAQEGEEAGRKLRSAGSLFAPAGVSQEPTRERIAAAAPEPGSLAPIDVRAEPGRG